MSSNANFALITGGSNGIGLELARCFAKDGHPLILAAENQGRLDRAAQELLAEGSPQVETISVDLAVPPGAPFLYDAVQRFGTVEYLVNNAGIGVFGDFVRETNLDDELRMIYLNTIAVVHLTKLFARDMVKRGSGRILITSSIAALATSPNLTVYSATKSFTYAFAEGVGVELKDSGVTVTALLPNATETDFFRRAGMSGTKTAQDKKSDPKDVAQAGYKAMMKGVDHVAAPFKAKLTAALTRVMPERTLTEQATTR